MKENSLEISTYIQIARKNYEEGNIYQANEIYRKLINKKIYTYDLLISYGQFNKEINNLNIAKNLFILSIKKYPSKIKAYILLAEILRKENNCNDALKTLHTAKNIEKLNIQNILLHDGNVLEILDKNIRYEYFIYFNLSH